MCENISNCKNDQSYLLLDKRIIKNEYDRQNYYQYFDF